MRIISKILSTTAVFATVALLTTPQNTQAASSFKDVPESSTLSPAVEFLKSRGILSGYSDGTFRPSQKVLRSEAMKIVVATKFSAEQVAGMNIDGFTDVPADAWYRTYLAAAVQQLGIVNGPDKSPTFKGANPVKKVEFLKMLLTAQGIDSGAYGEIALPLGNDVTKADEWYYPYMRYALSASMVMVDAGGNLGPSQDLTRSDVANLLYRLAMYQAGRRTQALLSEEESELVNVLQMLEGQDITQAEYASARALLAARGANASKSDAAVVRGAVKIAESFRALVRGYRAGIEGRLDDSITLSKDSWTLAESAKQISPDLAELAGRVQAISKNMADQARGLKS